MDLCTFPTHTQVVTRVPRAPKPMRSRGQVGGGGLSRMTKETARASRRGPPTAKEHGAKNIVKVHFDNQKNLNKQRCSTSQHGSYMTTGEVSNKQEARGSSFSTRLRHLQCGEEHNHRPRAPPAAISILKIHTLRYHLGNICYVDIFDIIFHSSSFFNVGCCGNTAISPLQEVKNNFYSILKASMLCEHCFFFSNILRIHM